VEGSSYHHVEAVRIVDVLRGLSGLVSCYVDPDGSGLGTR
jgi:hypothetical protein